MDTPGGEITYTSIEPQSENYSILMAMDKFGVIGFMVFAGSVKSIDYIAFLYKLVQEDLNQKAYQKSVFLMENASIHKSELFEESCIMPLIARI